MISAAKDGFCLGGTMKLLPGNPKLFLFGTPDREARCLTRPRYHFDVIGRNTIADRTGLLLPDDIHASDAADRLASELYEIRPELRVRECAVLVTDDDGEEVHRAPIVKVH
jgi:hypothetical protein